MSSLQGARTNSLTPSPRAFKYANILVKLGYSGLFLTLSFLFRNLNG